MSVVLRGSSAVAGALVALIGLTAPADPAWVVPSVVGLLAWSALFSFQMLRRGLQAWLILGDIFITVVLCLLQARLVPDAVLLASAGTGWVDLTASTAVFIAQFVMRQPYGLMAALLITAAHMAGVPGSREAPVVLVAQGLLAAALLGLLRRAAESADATLVGESVAQAEAQARAAARTDELDQQRQLHDTVLATLTMVGIEGVNRDSHTIRQRALADLQVIDAIRTPRTYQGTAVGTARLDLALRTVMPTRHPGLPAAAVEFDMQPLQLPREVVAEISQSVAEALSNVARHAGTGAVQVTAGPAQGGVIVEVRDLGRGFDTGTVPPHRRGLRESIVGRMTAVGGSAEIVSSPGAGTRVLLRWRP